MLLLFENETAAGTWEPIGIGEADSPAAAIEAAAQLAVMLLPGRFRYLAVDRAYADWHYLELDTTGAVIETLT
jgi:hypothetical protein